jgi:DNA polymerase I-like protein with 3'-5' exonuclease and polymerase domains
MVYFIGDTVNFTGIENTSIDHLIDYCSTKDVIGFDTETTGFDAYLDRLLAYQVGDETNQFVVDADMYPIEWIKSILLDKELIIHNAKFDLRFLYAKDIYPPKIWDTYLGECVLYKGDKTTRKSLEATVHRYFNYLLTKTTRGKIFHEGFSKKVIEYCAEDVKYLPGIKGHQVSRMKKSDLLDSMNLENLFVKVLTYIEYSGIYLDTDLWKKKVIQDRINYESSLIGLDNWIIEHSVTKYLDAQLDLFSEDKKTVMNWSSPKQVAELFQSLGVDTKIPDEDNPGEMKDSVEAGVLEKQVDKSELIPLYLAHKKYEKILSTYGDNVLTKVNPITGRIHTSFTQIMDTGRLSSGGKMGDKETINLQNIPRMPEEKEEGKIYERECFTAEKGNLLVNADYSGQEQVVFANFTQDKDLLLFYKKGLGDMHSFIASKIFFHLRNIPLKVIKNEYKKERQIAKSAGFAINYGGDGNTLAENLNISKEEGEEIYKAYFEAFPGVADYFKKATKQALRDGYILFNEVSKSKCYIHFYDQFRKTEEKVQHPGFWEKYREEKEADSLLYRRELKPLVSKYFRLRGNISRMALNYPIQGSSAEITKLACIYIFDFIVQHRLQKVIKFSNVIHDEILLECPEEMAEETVKVVKDCMERAGNMYCKTVPLKADIKICTYWNH